MSEIEDEIKRLKRKQNASTIIALTAFWLSVLAVLVASAVALR